LLHHENFATFQPDSAEDDLVMSLLSILKMAEYISDCYRKSLRDEKNHEWDVIVKDVLNFMGLCDDDFRDLLADVLEQLQNT
jgi:hypothetical protein